MRLDMAAPRSLLTSCAEAILLTRAMLPLETSISDSLSKLLMANLLKDDHVWDRWPLGDSERVGVTLGGFGVAQHVEARADTRLALRRLNRTGPGL